MDKIYFVTAGVPHSTEKPSTSNGILRNKELGLGAMELEFVRQARMGVEKRGIVAGVQKETGLYLSAHAPYYINLNSVEQEKLDEVIFSHIQKVLSKTEGKIHGPDGAANLLGINPSTLRGRMNKLGIKYGRGSKN